MKEDLVKKFKEEFEKFKSERTFKASFEELEEIFFLEDFVITVGYVLPSFNRMLCYRLSDTLGGWGNRIESWLTPSQSISNFTEHQTFSESEHKDLLKILNTIRAHTIKNSIIGLSKDIQEEDKYIDDSLTLWREILPTLIQFQTKVYDRWKSLIEEDKK